MKRIGVDIGSVSVSAVRMDNNILDKSLYFEHKGNIRSALEAVRVELSSRDIESTGLTGGQLFQAGNPCIVDTVVSQVEGIRILFPQCRNLLMIGAETFILIQFDNKGRYVEHKINPPCAAGTGGFIDQQAERLGFTTAELSRKAGSYRGKVPAIATRCAVFAKTDIIHAMQEGYSKEAVCTGLCEGIARNVIDSVYTGREFCDPLVITGGVSLNPKVVESIEKISGVPCRVPDNAHLAGAIGAAMSGSGSLDRLLSVKTNTSTVKQQRPRLQSELSAYPDFSQMRFATDGDVEFVRPAGDVAFTDVHMGIDIGSTSTKAIFINEDSRIIGGLYTKTGGDPVGAVVKLLEKTGPRLNIAKGQVRGVSTTGSGRLIIKSLFNADHAVNEITAHAKAAVFLDPDVDTIFEIGGQDSKYIRLRNGEVYFSTMNYVCAAGTGSFIEEQAKRLGLGLEELQKSAFGQTAPYTSDRCTVYMERDLRRLESDQWDKDNIAAAILHSVRDNYFTKVVNKTAWGRNIVFQGATARNKALVSAFEQHTGQQIHVSPYCHLTGALGAALIARENGIKETGLRFELDSADFVEEDCALCANRCKLQAYKNGSTRVAWGMKCGKAYDARGRYVTRKPAVISRRQNLLAELYPQRQQDSAEVTAALPAILYNEDYRPLLSDFLAQLGVKTTVIKSSRNTLKEGKKRVLADFCAPMIAAHGIAVTAMHNSADFVFLPAITGGKHRPSGTEGLFAKKKTDDCYCFYSQYLPTIISNLPDGIDVKKIAAPIMSFSASGTDETITSLHAELSPHIPGISRSEIAGALEKALKRYEEYTARREQNWEEHKLHARKPAAVVLGRPYTFFDKALNAGLPGEIESLGIDCFFQDELPVSGVDIGAYNTDFERMHWHYGRMILKAAQFAARTEGLYPVYVSSFRCSPDAFLLGYVEKIFEDAGKPLLILQLDEHSSAVGYKTRLEAGFHSILTHYSSNGHIKRPASVKGQNSLEGRRTVLLPALDEMVTDLWCEAFISEGYKTVKLLPSEKGLAAGYLYTSGGECMPLVSIIGSIIEAVREGIFNPDESFLFLPTVCMACNFPQFTVQTRLALEKAGHPSLYIPHINTMNPTAFFTRSLSWKMLEANIIGSILHKIYHRHQPHETRPGFVNRLLLSAKQKVSESIANRERMIPGFKKALDLCAELPGIESSQRKPRLAIIGDLYVKYNSVINQELFELLAGFDCEIVLPSLTEYAIHFMHADAKLQGRSSRSLEVLRRMEARYEEIAAEYIGPNTEPAFEECVELAARFGVTHYIPGETMINVGRAAYLLEHDLADAVIHINPIFCCPGVVTSSIFRKMQRVYNKPVIDICYDGTGSPNDQIIPHIHFLKQKMNRHEQPPDQDAATLMPPRSH